MVLRSEKEALADELRTKTERVERLEALKVAVVDPVPASQPEPESSDASAT